MFGWLLEGLGGKSYSKVCWPHRWFDSPTVWVIKMSGSGNRTKGCNKEWAGRSRRGERGGRGDVREACHMSRQGRKRSNGVARKVEVIKKSTSDIFWCDPLFATAFSPPLCHTKVFPTCGKIRCFPSAEKPTIEKDPNGIIFLLLHMTFQ